MKHNSDKKEDPLPNNHGQEKEALDGFNLFYEALPFEASYAEDTSPRLRRPSRIRG